MPGKPEAFRSVLRRSRNQIQRSSALRVEGSQQCLVYNACPMPRALEIFRSISVLAIIAIGGLCVRAQQTLRWGADPSGGAPYVFNDPNHPDRYIGYEKEIVDALAAAMGRKPEFVASDWETLVSSLQRGSFDVIVNGLEPTGDRAKQVQFSKPYYVFQLALTVRVNEQQIHSLADCRSRVVGTLGNTAASRL